MKIVGIHLEPGAVGWHRLWCFTEHLAAKGHDVWHRPHAGTQFEWDELDGILRGADVVVAGRMHNAQVFAGLLAGRDLYHYKLVVDTDDDPDTVPRYNQAFTDYHAGSSLSRLIRAQFKAADLVTVSTGPLRDVVSKYAGRVAVVPNVINDHPYERLQPRVREARHANDIRIYWGGGAGHYDDLLVAKDALLRLFNEDSRVKLVFSNFIPDWAADLPPFRVFMIPFAHWNAYPKVLNAVSADIAIAPLVNNAFNKSKSHVKYLMYGMARVPGIYSNLDAYETVEHGLTGLKANTPDDWYTHLITLIQHPELRRQIADRAERDIRANWNVNAGWGDRYESILREVSAIKSEHAIPHAIIEGQPPVMETLTTNA